MNIIYVSGKYRAQTIFGVLINIWRARQAAKRLWEDGWIVICPHTNSALMSEDYPHIQGDLEIITRCCDAIYLLRNWDKSEGAKMEYAVARKIGLEIYFE